MNPITTIALTATILFALSEKLHLLLRCCSDLLHAHTTPAWRVETMYAVLIKLTASVVITVILLRMLGMVVGAALMGSPRKTRQPTIYLYPRVEFCAPGAVPAAHRCAICLCEGSSNAVLECGHAFHWGCVRPWLDVKNKCPLCARRQVRLGVDGDGLVVV